MDTAPALLLLLTLGFCCPGIYGQSLQIKLRYPKDITQLRVGEKLELECHTDKSHGASWIRQDRSGTLHFIVFINALSRATFGENQRSRRFEASKDNTIYRLAVKSFTPQDEGSYFCVMNFNQMLHFSPGLRAFLPVTTTVAPSTPGSTTQRGISEDPDLTTPDPAEERMQENLNFFCHIFIWVPLAGALLLLLIALVITIVLCQQTRRRRCRCKRPANGKPPTKPRTPN